MRVLGVLVAVAALASPVHADAVDSTSEADELFVQGRDALTAGKFEDACKLFFSAQEKQRENPAILINLGLCNEKQDRLASALRWYRKTQLLTQGKTDATNKEYEETARERVNALQSQVSKVTFALGTVQPNAELLIDGETISRRELIVDVDRGPHVIEVRADGMVTSREPLNVDGNGKQLTFTFHALAPLPSGNPRNRRRLRGALIGGGVIVATSVVTYFWGRSVRNGFECDIEECPTQESRDDKNAKNLLPVTITFAAGMALGVGVAAYFFFTKPKEERQMAIAPTVTSDGLGFAMFRRF